MRYAKVVRIPTERVGALIGKDGVSKKAIQQECHVVITVDGATGEVLIEADDVSSMQPFKAAEIITAIGRGFSHQNAMLLLNEDIRLHVMDIRQFARTENSMQRIRGRIIGERGRARRNMERLARSRISVYGKTVSVIGEEGSIRTVVSAINSLLAGGMHASAYGMLEAANRKRRLDRMLLWEGQNV